MIDLNIDTGNVALEEDDVLGGTIQPTIPSGIYTGTVVAAYGISSKDPASKSKGIRVKVQIALPNNPDESVTLAADHYYMGKDGTAYTEDGKTFQPGLLVLESIALFLTAKSFKEQVTRPDMIVTEFDFESRKDLEKSVTGLPEWLNKPIKVAVSHNRSNKRKWDANSQTTTIVAGVKESNVIKKFFHVDGRTSSEIRKAVATPIYANEWLAKYGNTYDTYKEENVGKVFDKNNKEVVGAAGQAAPQTSTVAATNTLFAGLAAKK